MARILILWNQIDDDVYEHYRRDGRRAPDWNPTLEIEPWDSVEDEMHLIERSLEAAGHEVASANVKDDFHTMLEALEREKPDVVMNLVEFFHNDPEHEHHVPALFELLNMPYTGNRPLSLSMCQKKPQAKALMTAAGIRTPRGIVIDQGVMPRSIDLRYPLIVKPAFDDASCGIDTKSVVRDRAALEVRVDKLWTDHKMAALVEEYIEGREIHCAILGDKALPLYEMEFKGGTDEDGTPLPNIITYRAKWDPYSRDHHAMEGKCPATDVDDATSKRIQATALAAYRALTCRDYARVDMRYVPDTGEVFVLEVNPNPDLADTCAFATAARASGRTYAQMINEILGFAIARSRAPKVDRAGFDMLLNEYMEKKAADAKKSKIAKIAKIDRAKAKKPAAEAADKKSAKRAKQS
jgi:D-alanine-D-alanine ligase